MMEVVILFSVLISTNMVAVNSVGQMDVFSTNTMLSWLNKTGVHRSEYLVNGVDFGVSTTNCMGVHVSIVVRQSAHFPAKKELEQMKALHKKIMTNKDPKKFSELDHWRIPHLDLADNLVQRGKDEILQFGERIGQNFNYFFNKFYNSSNLVKFVSSSDHKAVRTSKFFHHGLADHVSKIPTFKNEINDSMIKFSEKCFNHERQMQDEGVFLKEYFDFLKRAEFRNIMDSLKRKLGLQINLTEDDVFMINDWCAYGMFISGDTTWCKLLLNNDRLVLEYGKDLLNYYKYSYGNPINAKMSCSFVRDIFSTFEGVVNTSWNYFEMGEMESLRGEDLKWFDANIKRGKWFRCKQNGVILCVLVGSWSHFQRHLAGKFQFGDVDTIIPLVTALGLFKDKEPLLATNMAAMKNRKFKTSQISPFTGSVSFMLYACDNTRRLALSRLGYYDFSPGQQEIRIQAFVNEIRVPFCEHSFYCLYNDVKERFKDFIKNCNMTDVCGTKRDSVMETTSLNSGMKRHSWNMLLLLITLFILRCLS